MLQVVKDTCRLLTFRITREEMLSFGWKHLAFGLICTWIVGIGRNWDNPEANILQHLGVGSVVYIFALSIFLLIFIAPLRARNWSYFRVLTFVALVSPPAILYAIPLENFVDLDWANSINRLFLLVVAGWRVALLIFAQQRFFEMDGFSSAVATFLPLSIIVIVLGIFNLDHTVFNVMGGIRAPSSPRDPTYNILMTVFIFSILLFPFLFVSFIVLKVKGDGEPLVSLKDEPKDQ
jgi:hypothetical protein